MKDGTSPICPCYKCHKLFLIHANSLVGCTTSWFVLEEMVSCFWGSSWESLIPSPTQRTGIKETNGTMPFSTLWAQLPCPGTCPLLFTNSWLSLHVPNNTIWCILSSLQCARTMGNASACAEQRLLRRALSTRGRETGLAAEQRKLYPCWQQQLVLPKGSESDSCHLLVCRAVLKDTQSHLGVFFIKTADKPWVVHESHLLKIWPVKQ